MASKQNKSLLITFVSIEEVVQTDSNGNSSGFHHQEVFECAHCKLKLIDTANSTIVKLEAVEDCFYQTRV